MKKLLQINSANFAQLYSDMQDLINKYDSEQKHPNVLGYHKASPFNLNDSSTMPIAGESENKGALLLR